MTYLDDKSITAAAGKGSAPTQPPSTTAVLVGPLAPTTAARNQGMEPTLVSLTLTPEASFPGMSIRRRLANILGLSMCWCLMVSVLFIQISTSTLAAKDYGGATTSTLPAGVMMAAATLTAIPGTVLMKRHGRRPVMLLPGLAAAGGCALLAAAAQLRLLWLLIVATIPIGVCFAQANNLRFAAMEFAHPGFESNALSLVVMGAALSAVVGPELARHTRNALPTPYVGTYVLATGLTMLYVVLVCVIEFHRTADLVEEKAAVKAARAAAAAAAAGQRDCKAIELRQQGKDQGGERASQKQTRAGGQGTDLEAGGDGQEGLPGMDVVVVEQAAAAPPPAPPPPPLYKQGMQPAPLPLVASHHSIASSSSTASVSSPGAGGGGLPTKSGIHNYEQQQVQEREQLQPGTLSPQASSRSAGPPPPPPRPLSQLLLSWDYLVPTLTAGLVYTGMAGMMTATPLAVRGNNFSFDEATQVIQVHILCMFVPSLFTGEVIRILGARATMLIGSIVLLGGTAIFYASETVLSSYFGGNAAVGMGWNWAYVGGSALVAGTYRPEEKFVAQGATDTGVLLGTGLAGALAGVLYGWLGWVGYTGVFMVVNGITVIMDVVYCVRHVILTRRAAAGGQVMTGGKG